MQRLQPYYTLDAKYPLGHYFTITCPTNVRILMIWNGVELTQLETHLVSPALALRDSSREWNVPTELQHVCHLITQHIGTAHVLHVQYHGYFTLYTVTKLLAYLVRGRHRLAKYTNRIAITPNSSYHVYGLTRQLLTSPKRSPPPREVLGYYSTIDKSAARKILRTDGTPDRGALFRVFSFGGELDPELLRHIQRPTVSITYFNTIHSLRVDVPPEHFQH